MSFCICPKIILPPGHLVDSVIQSNVSLCVAEHFSAYTAQDENHSVRLFNATAFPPNQNLIPLLFNPAHERLCGDKYLLCKTTVQNAFIIYGSDRV